MSHQKFQKQLAHHKLIQPLDEVIDFTGYEFDCANVTGDTQVNIMDVNRMNLHFKGKSKLW